MVKRIWEGGKVATHAELEEADALFWVRAGAAARLVASVELSRPSFIGLAAASNRTSHAARASSVKRDTACELRLRRALFRLGLRYRIDVPTLPGRPDIVFPRARVAVFCDGDFWHGRNLTDRLRKLKAGHNAPYWVAKITSNVERDARHKKALQKSGWRVLRYWETDINRDAIRTAEKIAAIVAARTP